MYFHFLTMRPHKTRVLIAIWNQGRQSPSSLPLVVCKYTWYPVLWNIFAIIIGCDMSILFIIHSKNEPLLYDEKAIMYIFSTWILPRFSIYHRNFKITTNYFNCKRKRNEIFCYFSLKYFSDINMLHTSQRLIIVPFRQKQSTTECRIGSPDQSYLVLCKDNAHNTCRLLVIIVAYTKKRSIIRDTAEKQHSRDEQKTNEEIHIGGI